MNYFKTKLVNLISKSTEIEKDTLSKIIEVPPDKNLGDFSLPCFKLAKEFKKHPEEIAKNIKEKIGKNDFLSSIEVMNGYLNFMINKDKLALFTLKNVLSRKGRYGKTASGKNKKIMVEYSSPNTNKPLHLGHVRNDLLGMSVSKILEFNGYKIVKSSVINDRGMHICKSMLAYMKWGKNKPPNKKPDHFVGDFYVLFSQKLKENPGLEDEAKLLLQRWEAKDKGVLATWKKMNSWAYQGFKETYEALGSKFDKVYYESQMYEKGKEIVLKSLKEGIFKEEEGAIKADLSRFNIPDAVLMRSDKTTLYLTQDIYLAILKFKEYKLNKSIYVVGNEQGLHFKQLFAILSILGYKWAKDCYHLSYGYVSLPSGRMKSREGNVIDADTLIENMIELAKMELQKRAKLSKAELERRAKIIAMAAIKFFFLKYETFKDFTFDPRESIAFEGETGPYIQYTYARAKSILKKNKEKVLKYNTSLLQTREEQNIIDTLYKFPEVIQDSFHNYKPSLISRHLIELCQQFNEFYQKHQILKEEKGLMTARLALTTAVTQVIMNSASLLNIELLDQM